MELAISGIYCIQDIYLQRYRDLTGFWASRINVFLIRKERGCGGVSQADPQQLNFDHFNFVFSPGFLLKVNRIKHSYRFIFECHFWLGNLLVAFPQA